MTSTLLDAQQMRIRIAGGDGRLTAVQVVEIERAMKAFLGLAR